MVGIDTGMDSLGRTLNPDIYVSLDRDLPRSRKVNVTLDEEAVRVERIQQLRTREVGLSQCLPRSEMSSPSYCTGRKMLMLLRRRLWN